MNPIMPLEDGGAVDSFISSLTTAFSAGVGKITDALGAFAPIVIPVIVLGVVLTVGVKVFKKMTNKAG